MWMPDAEARLREDGSAWRECEERGAAGASRSRKMSPERANLNLSVSRQHTTLNFNLFSISSKPGRVFLKLSK